MKRKVNTQSVEKAAAKKKSIDYHLSLVDYHPYHHLHMCSLVQVRNMQSVAKLAKNARYICFLCGRAAKQKEHLCEPVAI